MSAIWVVKFLTALDDADAHELGVFGPAPNATIS